MPRHRLNAAARRAIVAIAGGKIPLGDPRTWRVFQDELGDLRRAGCLSWHAVGVKLDDGRTVYTSGLGEYRLTPRGRRRALSLTPGSPERERTLRPCRLATCAACRRRMGVGRLRRHERFECEKTPAALRAALLEQVGIDSEAVTRAIAAGKDCPADLLLGRLTPTPIDPALIAWGEALIERLRLRGLAEIESATLALMLSPAKPDGGAERAERIERARAGRRDAIGCARRAVIYAWSAHHGAVYPPRAPGFGVFVPSIIRARVRALDRDYTISYALGSTHIALAHAEHECSLRSIGGYFRR